MENAIITALETSDDIDTTLDQTKMYIEFSSSESSSKEKAQKAERIFGSVLEFGENVEEMELETSTKLLSLMNTLTSDITVMTNSQMQESTDMILKIRDKWSDSSDGGTPEENEATFISCFETLGNTLAKAPYTRPGTQAGAEVTRMRYKIAEAIEELNLDLTSGLAASLDPEKKIVIKNDI